MTAYEYLEEAISQANKDLSRLEERYADYSPGEKEWLPEAEILEDKIDNLRTAISYMCNANQILEESYE